jgi:hypothetical protein
MSEGFVGKRIVTCVEPTRDWSVLSIPRIKTMAGSQETTELAELLYMHPPDSTRLKKISGDDSHLKMKKRSDMTHCCICGSAAGLQETTEQWEAEDTKTKVVWMGRRIDQLMGVESELNTQLADAKAMNKHYEKVLDRLLHGSEGLPGILTDTQCDDLSRESNPVVWLVRGEVETQNHFTYAPYDMHMDAHIEFYTDEQEQYDGPPCENDEQVRITTTCKTPSYTVRL